MHNQVTALAETMTAVMNDATSPRVIACQLAQLYSETVNAAEQARPGLIQDDRTEESILLDAFNILVDQAAAPALT
jgi:hypothetical protein